MTGEQYLKQNGIDISAGSFATDVVQASTRVNYAQNLEMIHGLETMVCMATDGAMQVRGGNWRIFDGMLRASGANVLLNTSVSSIDRQPSGTYAVMTTLPSTLAPTIYDSIILAAPLQFANLSISPKPTYPPPEIPYVNLHVTLFTSPFTLNPKAFSLPSKSPVPTTILTTRGRIGLPYFSISTIRIILNPTTNGQEFLYKIFSPAPISDTWINSILDTKPTPDANSPISWIYRKLWQSYPYLPPRVTFEDIQLDTEGKVWYTSGIESFISTMETSSLMGMNVARLVVDGWEGKSDGLDTGNSPEVMMGGRVDKDL